MRLKLENYRKKGRAYAFVKFNDEKDISDIEEELGKIKKNAENKYAVHPELEVYVTKKNPGEVHPELNKYSIGNHTFEALLPGASHEETAREFEYVLNILYHGLDPSSIEHMEAGYEKQGRFHYEDKGKYHHLRKKDKLDDAKK